MSGSGVVSGEGRQVLVLTDVVDSTALAERLGAAANGVLWQEHDRVARALLAAHGGWEIERTDGITGLFGSVDAAVAFSAAYHAATRALPHPLVVRAAVHAGELTTRENPAEHVARGAKRLEVDGLGIAVAARVLSVCGGGATLLTSVAHAGLTTSQGTSQGHWRLKGVTEPVELFAVGEGAACSDAAKAWRVVLREGQWVPGREIPHSLPAERDAFVGRSDDLRALAERLDAGSRLISVLGIGGTGKTRLVTRFAWSTLGEYAGGAWFCDLSEARSTEGIAVAVAVGLGAQLGPDDPLARLGAVIAARGRCLVVLDNFEQVARHAAETVGRWSELAPDARFVVTTREVLGLPGETALALAPLVKEEAVALFVARAAQARRDFALAGDDAAHVQALVRLLDGLPLAIELAAARSRMMSPGVLLQRMGERFKLLASTGGRHTRQATLRGALDWSWGLLSADEQQALAQLSVFEGGFDLPAAEAVLSLAEAWPMDAVAALVDKSLVRALGRDRFDLLVSVQEYAAEKLEALGGRPEAEVRHGAWYAAFGEEARVEALDRVGGPELRRAYLADLDNLVVACRRALARGDGEGAVGAFLAAWAIFDLRGPLLVALELGDAMLGAPLPSDQRGAVLLVAAETRVRLGRLEEARVRILDVLEEARSGRGAPAASRRQASFARGSLAVVLMHEGRAEEAIAEAEAGVEEARRDLPGVPRDLLQEGRALYYLGCVLHPPGRIEEANAAFDASLPLLRAAGARRLVGHLLHNRGGQLFHAGRPVEALADFEESLALAREFDNRESESVVAGSLGVVMNHLGRYDDAIAGFERGIAAARALGNRRIEANVLLNLAALRTRQKQYDESEAMALGAIAALRALGDRRGEGFALLSLGLVDEARGRYDDARSRFHEALAVYRHSPTPRFEALCVAGLGEVDALQGRWDEAREALEDALTRLRALSDAASEAQVLILLTHVHVGSGQTGLARATIDAAQRLVIELHNRGLLPWVLVERARVEWREGHADRARATFAECLALSAEIGAGEEPMVLAAMELARAELGAA